MPGKVSKGTVLFDTFLLKSTVICFAECGL